MRALSIARCLLNRLDKSDSSSFGLSLSSFFETLRRLCVVPSEMREERRWLLASRALKRNAHRRRSISPLRDPSIRAANRAFGFSQRLEISEDRCVTPTRNSRRAIHPGYPSTRYLPLPIRRPQPSHTRPLGVPVLDRGRSRLSARNSVKQVGLAFLSPGGTRSRVWATCVYAGTSRFALGFNVSAASLLSASSPPRLVLPFSFFCSARGASRGLAARCV
jgi:hypothetical protein